MNVEFTAGSDNTALKRIAPRFVICQHSFAETVLKELSAENVLTFDKNDEGFTSVEGLLAKNTRIDGTFRYDIESHHSHGFSEINLSSL